jgi:hypothetical protein
MEPLDVEHRAPNEPQTGCVTPLPPRIYWTMVRDLLDEALSFAVTLRSAPYEALDRRGRELLLDAAGQLIDSGECVLDAIDTSVRSLPAGVALHPRLAALGQVTGHARARLHARREEIDAASLDAPVWRLADVVTDTRIELVQVLESISHCYGPTRDTQRRLRTYWDEYGHYMVLAGRACRRLGQSIEDAQRQTSTLRRLAAVERQLARLLDSFEFGLLRQANRHKLHALLERLRDAQASRANDELAQRRLWNEVRALVQRIAEDQSARAV